MDDLRRSRAELIREKLAGRPTPPRAAVSPRTSPASHKPTEIEVYYDAGGKHFWVCNAHNEWMEVNEASLKRILRSKGFSTLIPDNAALSPLEDQIMQIQLGRVVHYAGPLAGYGMGPQTLGDWRILVTRGAKHIHPKKGNCDTVRDFLGELLGEQLVYVLGWLKSAFQSLRAGPDFRKGHALILAGPTGCGKSLFQGLVTEILGGRVGKPYAFLTNEEKYNDQLFGAEHLAIEDEAASTDVRIRRAFGAKLKNLIANDVHNVRGMYKSPIPLKPFWRITITLNDEPEALMVLPLLNDDLMDKLILIRAFRVNFPFGHDDIDARQVYRRRLSAELPAFLAWLREWRVPEKLKDPRWGIKAWQNPGLVEALQQLSPEDRLLDMIDTLIADAKILTPWEGSSMQLEQELLKRFPAQIIDKLFSFSGACGTFLTRLRQRMPDRFFQTRGKGNTRLWRIDVAHGESPKKSDGWA